MKDPPLQNNSSNKSATSFPKSSSSDQTLTIFGLQAATDGFSPKNYLPEGRFISVFRGEMNGMVTAVKQYKDASNQGEREFNSEVQLISKTRRENLVVLGFCSEGDHRLLVYEYVCNVSLDQYLSNENEHTEHACRPLSWERRMKVALGAAKSLQYLVEGNATRNSRGFSPAPPDYESSSYCDSSESPSESEDTNFSVDTTSIRSMNARFPPTPPTQTFQRHPSSLPSVNDQKINRIRTKKRRSAL